MLASPENGDLCRDCLMIISHVNNRSRSERIEEDFSTIRTIKYQKQSPFLKRS